MSRWLEITVPADLQTALIAEGFESYRIEGDDVILYLQTGDTENFSRLCALAPSLTARERREEEWADAWKRYYKPVSIGSRLLIQPAWVPLDDSGGRVVYLNDPGMSFGTGLHASTRLCLEVIEQLGLAEKKILDIGCGSGILGLCALLLGAGHADGLDIDPSAVRTSIENARLNGVGDRYHASVCDFCRDGSALGYDLVFSNIIADVILPLVPKIAGTGVLWLASGIIEHRLDDVLNAAEAEGLTIRAIRTEDGWCAVLFAS